MPGYVEVQLGSELLAHQRRLHEEHAEDMRAQFEEIMRRAGVAAEWRVSDEPRLHALTLHARYCDLLVMGRHNDDSPTPTVNLVEAVVMDCAKPVLVIPDDGAPKGIGAHAMVAWNGSREAVRAVDAALPFLERAEQVDVVAADPRTGPGEVHGEIAGMDLCAHLARHGVRAEAQTVTSDGRGVGETLLARAAANGCDLLVMGAYGHARWREVILGGATAHVLRSAPLPLLLAH